MIKKDYLPSHKEITVYQDDTMFRMNTDTEVLGNFLNIHKNDIVLDMGTNQGALMLYASLFNPKKIIGLEINKEALKLAKMNMEENNIKNYELINDNIITYQNELVDVIICNPPYFKTKEDNKSLNNYKNLAKHEGELTLELLINSIQRNLRDGGELYFLNLSSRLDEVLEVLRKYNLTPKIVKFVHDINKEYSNVFLVKCIKNASDGMVVEKPIIIKR